MYEVREQGQERDVPGLGYRMGGGEFLGRKE